MRKKVFIFPLFLLFLIGTMFIPYSSAQEDAGEDIFAFGTGLALKYILTLSGTVHNEKFFKVNALLTLTGSSDFDPNPYLLEIQGYPKNNSRNSFYWTSMGHSMQVVSNEIICDIVLSSYRHMGSGIFFNFVSPVLTAPQAFETHREEERKEMMKKLAIPTVIPAQAGKIHLRIHADSVSGTIWMNGYDTIQKSYVFYSARFDGRKAHGLAPSTEVQKPWR